MRPGAFFEWDQRKASLNVEVGRPPFENVYRFRFDTSVTFEDVRMDYGEKRMTAIGLVDEGVHVLVYTVRGDAVRVISFRNANDREVARYDRETLGRIELEATPEKWAEARAASKRALAEMTPEEDAAITADAMSDPDSLPMTDEEFAAARRVPLSEALPFMDANLPLDADVLERLVAEGPEWRVRANAILRAALEAA